MGTFVSGNTALPANKLDAYPPTGLPTELDAADINSLWSAISDLRSALGFVTRQAVADASPTATASDSLIAYTSITQARIVTLPSAAGNLQQLVIKDESGSVTADTTISVVAPAGQSVDGVANPTPLVVVATPFGSTRLYSNGTAWFTYPNLAAAQSVIDTTASTKPGMLELLHNAASSTAYGIDIKSFADVPSAPGAGLGGGGAVAIHYYSDRGPGAFQLDNVRSQPLIVLRNTHNEFRALGVGGTGHFIDFIGYALGTPYSANGGLGTDPVFLGQLEGGLPGNPLTFASKNSATPWTFRSDTTAPSLKATQSNAGVALAIVSAGTSTGGITIVQSVPGAALNISADVGSSGFFPMIVTGYSHGPKFTTQINSGPVLTLSQTIAGGNQVFFIDNRAGGLSIRVNNGSVDTFTVDATGNIKVSGHSIDYGTAAPVSGAWLVADRRFNSAPAVGQPKSWVCTVAGSPGTWVSEGNL